MKLFQKSIDKLSALFVLLLGILKSKYLLGLVMFKYMYSACTVLVEMTTWKVENTEYIYSP